MERRLPQVQGRRFPTRAGAAWALPDRLATLFRPASTSLCL